MRARSVSSSLPAGPTNGSPCLSSLKPGASPTIITSAGHGPAPGTACVRVACRLHLVQPRTSSWRTASSATELSDFDSGLERDEVARLADYLQNRLQLLVREGHQRQPEGSGGEAHRLQCRLHRHRV